MTSHAPIARDGPIEPSEARYIKLGPGGAWERKCLTEGTLRLGYYDVPHEMGVAGDADGIRQIYLDRGHARRTASSHARQVLDFYHAASTTLWITFCDGFLWWSFAKPEVTFLGSDPNAAPFGSRSRGCVSGWSNKSLGGRPLRMSEMNGQLTAVSSFQGTICTVKAFDYLVGKINDEDLPEIVAARDAKSALLGATQDLLSLLTWRDFEILVELIFAQSGWRRLGETGGSQKTVDLELMLPTTGERAFVQVKSKADQDQLNEYVERLSGRDEARMFYVYHSAECPLIVDSPRVTLIGRARLSELVIETGLVDWLITKVG